MGIDDALGINGDMGGARSINVVQALQCNNSRGSVVNQSHHLKPPYLLHHLISIRWLSIISDISKSFLAPLLRY